MADSDFTTEVNAGSFVKNARSVVRGRLILIHDTPMADLRVFVGALGTGDGTPTKMGLCVRRDLLPELRDLVCSMITASEELAAVAHGGEPEGVRHGNGGDGEE